MRAAINVAFCFHLLRLALRLAVLALACVAVRSEKFPMDENWKGTGRGGSQGERRGGGGRWLRYIFRKFCENYGKLYDKDLGFMQPGRLQRNGGVHPMMETTTPLSIRRYSLCVATVFSFAFERA